MLKIDGFGKQLPRDILKDDKFRSCIGVILSLILYAALIVAAWWFFEVIRTQELKADGLPTEEVTEEFCVPKASETTDVVQANFYYPIPGTDKIKGETLLPGEDGLVTIVTTEEGKLTGNFAWGVVDLNDDQFTEVLESVGEFKTVKRTKDALGDLKRTDLAWHSCSLEELGLDISNNADAKFFKPKSLDTLTKLTKYAPQMKCFDEPINLIGNSETEVFE